MHINHLVRVFVTIVFVLTAPFQMEATELQAYVDNETGVQVSIPTSMVGKARRSTHGMNWASRSEKLNIDTLRFPAERSLDDVYRKLRGVTGRQLSLDHITATALHIEGVDKDLSRFIVRVEQLPNGAKHGVSIVVLKGSGGNGWFLAQRIANSFSISTAKQQGEPKPLSKCQQDELAFKAGARKIEVQLPANSQIKLGETLELGWRASSTLFKGSRGVYLYFDIPESFEVRGNHTSIVHFQPADDSVSGLAKNFFDAAENGRKLITIRLDQSSDGSPQIPNGLIRLRPLAESTFKISAGFTLLRHIEFGAEQDCDESTLHAVSTAVIAVTPPAPAYESPQACYIDEVTSPQVAIKPINFRKPRVGEPIEVQWNLLTPLKERCKTPLYIVLSMPERVRVAGAGVFALAPGAPGPFGLSTDKKKARVFVPLHEVNTSKSGVIKVTPYQTGAFDIDWKVVEIPTRVPMPLRATDFAGEQPAIAAKQSEDSIELDVAAGEPKIVVRDRFAIERPTRTTIDRGSGYVLQDFGSFFRVLDTKTDSLVLEREGSRPEFSETGRFLTAYLEDTHTLEVIDIIAAKRVATLRSEEKGTYIGRGLLPLAWGYEDSFLLAAPNKGEGFIINLLSDEQPIKVETFGDKHSSVGGMPVVLDLERAGVFSQKLVNSSDRGTTFTSIVKSGESIDFSVTAEYWPEFAMPTFQWSLGPTTKFSNIQKAPPNSFDEYLEAQGGVPQNYNEGQREELLQQYRVSYAYALKEHSHLLALSVILEAAPEGTAATTKIALTHQKSSPALVARGRATSKEEIGATAERAIAKFEEHTDLKFSANVTRHATGGPIFSQAYVDAGNREYSMPATWEEGFANVLTEHVNSQKYQDALMRWRQASEEAPKRKIYRDLREVPSEFSCNDFVVLQEAEDIGEEEDVGFVSPNRIMGRIGWRVGSSEFWLIQQDCWGGSGWRSVQLGLLSKRPGSPPELFNLLDDGEDKITDFGLNSGRLARAWVTDNQILLIAMPNRSLLVYDIKNQRRQAVIRDLDGSEAAAMLALSDDQSKIVQVTESGRLALVDVASGKAIVNGYHLDDEIVIYRDDGYYLATPEGAHFVYLKFPGVEGFHSFHQFAHTLERPDLVKAAVNGNHEVVDPQLSPPPDLDLEVEQTSQKSSRTAEIKYRASSPVGLKYLQVYIDGRPVQTFPLSGLSASASLELMLPPEAMYLAAHAVDSKGYESVAQEVQLVDPGAPSNTTLHVIAFGTDEYRDRAFDNLTGAQQDADNFVGMLQSQVGKIYSKVETGTRMEVQYLRQELPKRIRHTVASAQPNDTIVMFAAGHGEVGPDGKFYLATFDTLKSDLPRTALSWEEIAMAFDGVKARVIVFLDACRAGTASQASNDQAAAVLTSRSNPMAVIAAAKGRQPSKEAPNKGGGIFTNAIVAAVTQDRKKVDSNGNGVIELGELYGEIKGVVVDKTTGTQTPWIARNNMVGQAPLF